MVGLWYAANSYMAANESRNENFVIESIIRTSPHYRCHSRETEFTIFPYFNERPRSRFKTQDTYSSQKL
jgi:hypothetical protein